MSTSRRDSLASAIALCEAALGVVLLIAAVHLWTYEPGHSVKDDGTGAGVVLLLARGLALLVTPYAAALLFAASLLWRGRQSGVGLTMSLAGVPGVLALWALSAGAGFPALLVTCASLAIVALTLQIRVAPPTAMPRVDNSIAAPATYRTLVAPQPELLPTPTAKPGGPATGAPHPMFRIGSAIALVVLALIVVRAFGGQ